MNRNYLKYFFALLLFGSNGIVASKLSCASYEIVLMRTMIGSLFLIGIFGVSRQKITCYRKKKDLFFLVVSGAAMGASWMFLYEAYAQLGVGIASLLYYGGPVIVMLFSPVLFHERWTAAKVSGVISVLLGTILVNGAAGGGGVSGWGGVLRNNVGYYLCDHGYLQ